MEGEAGLGALNFIATITMQAFVAAACDGGHTEVVLDHRGQGTSRGRDVLRVTKQPHQ